MPPPTLAEQILERISVGVMTVDETFCLLQWNAFMAEHTGKRATEVLGRSLFEVFADLPEAWLKRKLRAVFLLKNCAYTCWQQRPYLIAMSHDRTVLGGVDFMRQDATFVPIKNPQGEVTAICITLYDRTDEFLLHQASLDANQRLTEALNRVEQLSREDGLTAILNRRVLDERLTEELARHLRYGTKAALLLIDIDHFKHVNDEFGHVTGDHALIHVAELIKTMIRDTDVFSRYGGEEFALLLPGVNAEGGRVLAERIRQSIASTPLSFEQTTVGLTVSVGVTELRSTQSQIEAIYQEADSALYSSKREGRNRVTLYSEHRDSAARFD